MPTYVYVLDGDNLTRFTEGNWQKFLAMLQEGEKMEEALNKTRPVNMGPIGGDINTLTATAAKALLDGDSWEDVKSLTTVHSAQPAQAPEGNEDDLDES